MRKHFKHSVDKRISAFDMGDAKIRNPSKNTIKKLMRPCNGSYAPGWGYRYSNYFLFNKVGAVLYIMSKRQICNREPKGFERYLENTDSFIL